MTRRSTSASTGCGGTSAYPIHADSDFYDLDGFVAGRDTLQPFEPEVVGDVAGLDLVHLQCHMGMDTLSWARRGARVTGLDFSAPAIETARSLADRIGVEDARFVVADVYDAVEVLGTDLRPRLPEPGVAQLASRHRSLGGRPRRP